MTPESTVRPPLDAKAGALVLLRHGLSRLNAQGRFSGWADCPLAPEGVRQAHEAGRSLRAAGLAFDDCFSSALSRAAETAAIVLGELGLGAVPVTRTWRLNERHDGLLEGVPKKEAADRYGADRVEAWRNGADAPPPPLPDDDPRHPRRSALYRGVAPGLLPSAECLRDAFRRVVGFFEGEIRPLVDSGRRVLVVTHGNPVRALVAHLEGRPEGYVPMIEIRNAEPIVVSGGLPCRLAADGTRSFSALLGLCVPPGR